jgi:thiamine-monophosphate kinase
MTIEENKGETLACVGEFGLIFELLKRTRNEDPRVRAGIGDDAAVLDLGGERLLLATCDVQIEGVHFMPESCSPEDIGARAAAVNLSDIAAMGGSPCFALVSLAAPASCETRFLRQLYDGLESTLRRFGAEIVGGNTARMPERVMVDVTLVGEVEPERLKLRRGAKPGDVLCVTGSLGASRAGLMLLKDSSLSVDETLRKSALRAYRTPVPRVREGRVLGKYKTATACIDISDGLVSDARHLAERSGVCVRIDAERVPISACAEAVAKASGMEALSMALGGGEDFELLFTVSRSAAPEVLDHLHRETGTRAVLVGEVQDGSVGVQIMGKDGEIEVLKIGFDHFFNV